jgi:hypothetical protein
VAKLAGKYYYYWWDGGNIMKRGGENIMEKWQKHKNW